MKLPGLIALGVLGVLIGCDSRQVAPPSSDILAVVGSREIRVADLKAEFLRRQSTGLALPSKEQVLEELVNREVLLARALQTGLDRDPELRRSWENSLIGRLKDKELRPQLEQATLPAEVQAKPAPSPSTVEGVQMRLAVLQLTTGRRVSEERRAELLERMKTARELAQKLPKDEPGFGPIAIHYSDEQVSRYQGGDRGWLDLKNPGSNLPAEVLKVAGTLAEVGSLSEVIVTDKGVYLVRLLGRRSTQEANLARQEPARHQRLLREERQRIEQAYLATARKNVGVELRSEALAVFQLEGLASPAPVAAAPPPIP